MTVVDHGLTDIPSWSIRPDWTGSQVERLMWNTSVLRSPTNAEQRFGTRLSPRQQFDFDFILEGQTRTFFDLLILRAAGSPIYAPLWHDVERLSADLPTGSTVVSISTAHTEFLNARQIMLWSSVFDYEVVGVSAADDASVTLTVATLNDWAAGTRVVPVKRSKIVDAVQTTRRSGKVLTATVRFQSMESNLWSGSIVLPSYNDEYLLEQRPNDTGDLSYSLEHILFELDNQTGLTALLDVVGVPSQQFRWYAKGREALSELKALLYALGGRRVPIWVPTYYFDLDLVSDITGGDTAFEVKRCGFTDTAGPFAARQNVVILQRDGTRLYRELTNSAIVGSGETERIAVTPPFASSLPASAVKKISFLTRMRLDQDTIELEHQTATKGLTTASAVFRYVKDAEPVGLVDDVVSAEVGAVFVDGSLALWNWPALVDSPTGTLSVFLYVDASLEDNPGFYQGGSLFFQPESGFHANAPFSGGTVPTKGYTIVSVSNAVQAVITLSEAFAVGDFFVGDPVQAHFTQVGWNPEFPLLPFPRIVALGADTITVDVDTTTFPAYNFGANTTHNITALNRHNILDITRFVEAVVTLSAPHDIQAGCYVQFIGGEPGTDWSNTQPGRLVLGVTSDTLTLEWDTSAYDVAYDPTAFGNSTSRLEVQYALEVFFDNTTGDNFLQTTTQHAPPHLLWTNVLLAWDTDHAADEKIVKLYFDDTPIPITYRDDRTSAFDIAWDQPHAGDVPPLNGFYWTFLKFFTGYVSELWFSSTHYVDLDEPENRAKFHTLSGKPVALGDAGELPTGSPPDVYLHLDSVPPDPYAALGLPVRVVNPRGGTGCFLDVSVSRSKNFVCSFWIWGGFVGLIFQAFINGYADNFLIDVGGELITVTLKDGAGGIFRFHFSTPVTGLVNIRLAVNTDAVIGSKLVQAYVGLASASITVDTDNTNNLDIAWDGDEIDFADGNGFIGDIWFGPGQLFDPGPKFIDGSGNPVDLGLDGGLVSGVPPAVFLRISGVQTEDDFFNSPHGSTTRYDYHAITASLLPSAGQFLANKARPGENLHLNYDWTSSFTVAPTSPSD